MNGSCGLLVGLTQRRLVARLGRECVEFKKLVMGHRVGPGAKLGYAVLRGADLYNAKKLGVRGWWAIAEIKGAVLRRDGKRMPIGFLAWAEERGALLMHDLEHHGHRAHSATWPP